MELDAESFIWKLLMAETFLLVEYCFKAVIHDG